MNPIKRFRQYREVILIDDYTFSGGGGRPIYTYYRYKVNQGHTDILFLRLATRGSLFKVFLLLFFQKRIIVNGIATFRHWSVYPVCFLKKNVIIYLHEAAPHVEPFRQGNPLKFRFFKYFLGHRKIAFVSDWQQRYFEGFTRIPKARVVFNALNFPALPEQEEAVIKIGSIGFQSRYKNIDFYSKVADEAVRRGLPYRFYWVGGEGGEMKQIYHSPQVIWLGDQDQVMDMLNHFDVIFFPSYGDTFGLVLIEALFKGKRIVSYVENGLAPFLKVQPACRVYDVMDETEALKNIGAVLKENVDLDKHRALAYELCDVRKLESRLQAFFNDEF
jgi:glycosyltransferase involved in cell wall biosynthesis